MTNFTTTIIVGKSPADTFNAILDPRSWWGAEIKGNADTLGEEWSYRYKDLHFSRQKTVELVPGRKIVWEVVDARMSFLRDTGEWKGTKMVFELEPKGEGTQLRFTHLGLVPEVECFDICTDAWTGLIQGSLKNRIEMGVGDPDSVEKVA